MLKQVLTFFEIKPDCDLNIMKSNQDLVDITSRTLVGIKKIIKDFNPDIVIVQGDTTTALASSLGAFYAMIKIAHVEAGLRTHQMYSPFPEEMNRKIITQLAYWHFAPTQVAKDNLLKEGIVKNVYITGNTIVDALLWAMEKVNRLDQITYFQRFKEVDFSKKIILVTAHRRETFGAPLNEICKALKLIAISYPDVEMIYPVHLNPQVKKPVFKFLKGIKNIHLFQPLSYDEFIWLMNKSYFILTDSGGIQEEAPTFGKPVLVMRNYTERTEIIDNGNSILVGTKFDDIMMKVNELMNSTLLYSKMISSVNPYGTGDTSKLILEIITKNVE